MYITPEEYTAAISEPAPDSFLLLERQARAIVDRETGGALRSGLNSLPQWVQCAVKEAMALEIHCIDNAGGLDSGMVSASLGKFSYTIDGKRSGLSPDAMALLLQAGLLYRGVDV